MFNQEQLKILNNELDSNRVKSRSKGNVNLSYLEGFDIIDTANRVFGFGNWDYNISNLHSVSNEINQNQNQVVCYKAVVQVSVYSESHSQNISREDVGFGTGVAKTLADAHEGAAKEAVTDALKRALRSFGNQFGNSLYSKGRNQTNNQQYTQQNQTQYNSNNNQQNYNHLNSNSYSQPYQYNQDFSQLTNLGLTVVQQGENLIVTGESVFENKDAIKNHGFRWDGNSKTWYMSLRQAA